MLEAMACGLPSITSRIGGTAATIDDGVSGFFVKPGDTAAMTEKLGLLAGHPELRALLAKNAREKAVRAFDKTLILQQYLSASRRLILDAN
jgi:glycosyltransferase involved in cell wall biosynthesis